MASLFELITLKQSLITLKNNISIKETLILKQHSVNEQLSSVVNQNINDQLNKVQEQLSHISQTDNQIQIIFDNMIHQLTVEVDAQANERFKKFVDPTRFNNEHSLGDENNVIAPTEQDLLAISSRINQYISWRYPGLQLNCRIGLVTRSLVSCDPLYITDGLRQNPLKVVNTFPTQYRKRIRPYNVTYDTLHQLPQGTFGFIIAWELFNYFTLSYMENYLKKVWELLRPGGIFIFTYNNCDLPESVRLAELEVFTWAPLRILVPMCRRLGFEIIYTQDLIAQSSNYCSWIEIRKPGELTTIKKHQVLGKILNKYYE